MQKEFEYMLKIFIKGALGQKTKLPDGVDGLEILSMAKAHGIYPSVAQYLITYSEGINLDNDKKTKIKEWVENIQLQTYLKQVKLAEILKQFEKQAIPYALIKGFTAAILYSDPYSRLSSDIDLLVNLEDEKKAENLLIQYGFTIKKMRTPDDKHGILYHPILGMLELHISLYNKNTAAVWFNAANKEFDIETSRLTFDNLEKITVDDMYFYTLEINKRIEYLFLHNVKHFILGGSSIRAMMDFFLTYTRCKDIDYELFFEKIKIMQHETLFNTIISAIERFASFENIKVPFYKKSTPDLIDIFLEDMYIGKWLGYGSENCDAEIGWRVYEQEKQRNVENKFQSKTKKIVNIVFPSINRLRNNYKYALKYPVLVPVAWIHRIFKFLFGKKSIYKKNEIMSYSNGTRRVQLLRQMKMM